LSIHEADRPSGTLRHSDRFWSTRAGVGGWNATIFVTM
jgi:hypothetical protein